MLGPDPLKKKIPTWMNPKNWGVADYTDRGSFDTAYSAARKAGEKEFMWSGQRYSTAQKNEDRAEANFYLSKNQREKIYKSVTPEGYPQQEFFHAAKKYITGEERKIGRSYQEKSKMGIADEDAWAFFMGVNQQSNSIKESKYKPKNSTTDAKYYTLKNAYPNEEFERKILEEAKIAFNKTNTGNEYGKISDDGNRVTGFTSSFYPLENVTYSKGKDERGDYYSIYDVYDFNVPFQEKIGKPYEVYDRVYYKDYGNGKINPMYYTDKELSGLDPNKKNFDTLALQRELSNRGYKLPKSRKADGRFDGIFGEETRTALLNYQKFLRKKQ